ncbi:MAG: cryptochrome/photolyase family protein [Cyanobacteria bacterium M_surface_10_m1_298]|nr:cryptochrome/photolyase family protein [Cyanobacteria bacterium M_surface_10_m1_298]
MTIGIWVLGDQLNLAQSALASADPAAARVLLVESTSVLQRRAYHRQKLVLVWSAMRHFASELRTAGWRVDLAERESFGAAVRDWIASAGISELRVMEPADRGFREAIEALRLPLPLHWITSNAFLWSREEFAAWAQGYKQLRLELFYREGRRRFGVLMEGEGKNAQPLGGQWNFDAENRKPPPKGLRGPEALWFEPDAITQSVMLKLQRIDQERAESGLPPLPGELEPFRWAVNREQALAVLEHFIVTRLAGFGPFQDAMVSGEPTLWHALLSPYLNLGLLHPLEVIRRLEQAGLQQQVPLAGLEGVIRQILGWREYTHGLYHWFGADYPALNHFGADQPLPQSFEQLGGSGLNCLDSVLEELRSNGYAHHIQRLMVLANYGLIAGLDPQALTAWFHRMFIDGHDWVMQTNVIGMGLFADGGRLASKPYAASGNYINRMSTYCKGCSFDVKQRHGPKACPFNSLYWDFLARHAESLRRNPRMGLVIKQLDKLPAEELDQIRASASNHLQCCAAGR